MDPMQAILLGLIQGVTEWLPISSTGHLRLTELLLDIKVPLLFDVTLHIGTLVVVILFFRKDVKAILLALAKRDFKSDNGKLILLIIIGTIPSALIGGFLVDKIEELFITFLPIAVAFISCGIVLYLSKFGQEQKQDLSYLSAIAIGIAQGIALIPGISRSGLTIATALLLGLKREKAFKFSFLLSVPAVISALGLTLYEQHEALTLIGVGWTEILIGISTSLVISYFALKLLWKTLVGRRFYLFAFYCWLIGALLLLLSLGDF
ncbi:undecaprenyl-diphosphate phosphatase [Candidatus Bathyarchaeota archaeon]|nr:undecaprenyl-diphosphate phosphatase [Candidatus Bathyarchaeota archaeon]